MANQAPLDVLKQEIWNQWRKKDSSIQPDLSEADLRYADLAEGDFSLVNLVGANLHFNLYEAV